MIGFDNLREEKKCFFLIGSLQKSLHKKNKLPKDGNTTIYLKSW